MGGAMFRGSAMAMCSKRVDTLDLRDRLVRSAFLVQV